MTEVWRERAAEGRAGRVRRGFAALAAAGLAACAGATEVSFLFCYDPDRPEEPATRRILDLVKADGSLEPVKWGGLVLPGAGGRATFMLALAGGSAPDIYKAWFHILRHDVAQGFVYPLDEWLKRDDSGFEISDLRFKIEGAEGKDSDGPEPDKISNLKSQISNEPADLWEKVSRFDGHVWALPTPGIAYYGLVYRKDLVREAGLDPEAPPRTWSAFRDWCVALTKPGRRAFAIENRPWGFLPWVQSANGDVIRMKNEEADLRFEISDLRFSSPRKTDFSRVKRGEQAESLPVSSRSARPESVFRDEAINLKSQISNLKSQISQVSSPEYEACFDSPEAVAAAEYLQSLVRLGVVRGLPTLALADEVGQLFANGEIAVVFGGEDLVRRLTDTLNFPPDLIGLMPFPARDESAGGGARVLQAHRHFYAMSESVAHRPKEERDQVWRCLAALASPELADEDVRRSVAEGRAMWCRPDDLVRLGFAEEAARMPPGLRGMYADLARGDIRAVTEPWVGFWQAASDLIQRRFLGLLLSDAGPGLDCAAALRSITVDANRGLMFDSDRSEIERARPFARIILGAVVSCALVAWFILFSSQRRRAAETQRNVANVEMLPVPISNANEGNDGAGKAGKLELAIGTGNISTLATFRCALSVKTANLLPWLFLAPALVSVLLWSYYPLVRGAVMAFQDYRIVGASAWAGLDNFIRVATDPGFWAAWGRTLEYVALTLALGFVTPVVLAVMLCEIPRGKVLFRFLYFLPHLTSALVVTLLWKLMFDPTENGILNRVLATVGVARHSWLLDPAWAMVCCILPGVWAGAGISSLIYIAALSSLPQDYYEAAALDGAGFLARLRHVTLPQLAPLMVINFVGAFIAAFQGMGSIFLLTFGGPGDATQVLSLQIWKEAYNNLRFSTATTMAWFLGVALIGFTYLQIRLLRRVEFRRARA